MNDLELLSFDLNTGYLGESNGYNSSVEITLKFKKKNLPHLLSTGLLFSFSLSMQFIGAFRLSVKCGRCQMILPVSPHKLYVQQSQQAVRGADGTSIGLDKNKPAGQHTVTTYSTLLERRFRIILLIS